MTTNGRIRLVQIENFTLKLARNYFALIFIIWFSHCHFNLILPFWVCLSGEFVVCLFWFYRHIWVTIMSNIINKWELFQRKMPIWSFYLKNKMRRDHFLRVILFRACNSVLFPLMQKHFKNFFLFQFLQILHKRICSGGFSSTPWLLV